MKQFKMKHYDPNYLNKFDRDGFPKRVGNATYYCLYGQIHRFSGPAVERDNGDKEYHVYGIRHREDGPAVECSNGHKQWYRNGTRYHEEDPDFYDKELYPNGFKIKMIPNGHCFKGIL